jgi:hypothetical protein
MAGSDGQLKIHYTQVKDVPHNNPIYRECQTFQREMPRLLAEGLEGKVALVKGDEIIGIFADEAEAIRVGREKYLMQPFMVKPILEWEPVYRQYLSRLCHTLPSR